MTTTSAATTTRSADQTMRIQPLSGTIGATITRFDARAPFISETIGALRSALGQFKVIFLPGLDLDPGELVAFAAQFGTLTRAHPVMPSLDGFPEILEVDAVKSRQDPRYRDEYENDTWHADVTFMKTPPLGSLLEAKVLPPAGGDTAFVDCQAAYEHLSEPIQLLLDGLSAVHDGSKEFQAFLDAGLATFEWDGQQYSKLEPVEHPVVRTHPETGDRGLFVNPLFTSRISGLTTKESDALLAFLYAHMTSEEFAVRYHWSVGDVAFWDNRATLHLAIHDYGPHARIMHRVTLAGDVPA